MPRNHFLRPWLGTITMALVISCSSDSTAPPDRPGDERPADELQVVRLRPGAPPLEADSMSFWAHRGTRVEEGIYFLNEDGGRGDQFVALDLEDESLDRYPDGTPFVDGDSVFITIKVVDPALVLFEFAPAGLRFSADAPARLRIRYAEADDDFNDDGEHDDEDDDIELRLGIWRQERLGDPFVRLGTLRGDFDDLEADLDGFSRYAIAY